MCNLMQLLYVNGGGECYVVSVEDYETDKNFVDYAKLKNGLDLAAKVDEITLIVFPDAINLEDAQQYYSLHKDALNLCAELKDRMTVMDVWKENLSTDRAIATFRNFDFGDIRILKYGAVYYPRAYTNLTYNFDNHKLVKFPIDMINDHKNKLK